MEEYNKNTYVENIKIQGYLTKEYAIHKNGEVREKMDRLMDVINNQRKERDIERWENLNMEFKEPWDVPSLPRDEELMNNYVIPALYRCGAIAKKDLKKDHYYFGKYRNSNYGKWNGEKFEIQRYEWNVLVDDDCFHFEDDDGFALFVPIREVTEKEFLDRELNI